MIRECVILNLYDSWNNCKCWWCYSLAVLHFSNDDDGDDNGDNDDDDGKDDDGDDDNDVAAWMYNAGAVHRENLPFSKPPTINCPTPGIFLLLLIIIL